MTSQWCVCLQVSVRLHDELELIEENDVTMARVLAGVCAATRRAGADRGEASALRGGARDVISVLMSAGVRAASR